MKNNTKNNYWLFSIIIFLVLILAVVFYKSRNEQIRLKEFETQSVNKGKDLRSILSISTFPINGADKSSMDNLVNDSMNIGKGVWCLRISHLNCDNCVGAFIKEILQNRAKIGVDDFVVLVSTELANDVEYYKDKFPQATKIYRVSDRYSILDTLNVPYFFKLDSDLYIKNAYIYGLNSLEPVATSSGSEEPGSLQNSDTLSFSSNEILIPPVKAYDSLNVPFLYENRTKNDISITNVTVSCGCTVAEWNKKVIKPGEAGKIVFKVKPAASGNFIVENKIYTNNKFSTSLTIKSTT